MGMASRGPLRSILTPCILLISGVGAVNDRPVVGIITEPLGTELSQLQNGAHRDNRTYIAASYVKFAESAGARVVPVHFIPQMQICGTFSVRSMG